MRILIKLFAIFYVFTGLAQGGSQKNKPKLTNDKPNVIFFLVDDFGWKDVGYNGTEFYETPNIDKIANEGMKFNQAYAAHPRCVPSRFAMITGKYPAREGIPGKGGKDSGKLKRSEFGIAKAFKAEGYATFFAGKWHLASAEVYPEDQGFDVNIGGGHAGAPGSYFYPYNKSKNKNHHAKKIEGLEDGKEGDYLTDILTNKTLDFIKENKNKPFFVYLSHYGVHTPFEGKDKYNKKYKTKLKKNPVPSGPDYLRVGSTGETKTKQDNPIYASMIQSVDDSFGEITDLLDELGLTKNTIIVFTSDHGGLSNRGNKRRLATSNLPLRAGKGHNYDGGVRVPMFVKWPGVTKKSETNFYITGTDYYPTLLEMTGLPLRPEQHLDGKSFKNTLTGNRSINTDRPIFWHSPVPRPVSTGDRANTAVRKGDFKLIDFYEENRLELYNIKNDIGEIKNLANKMPTKRDELLKLIKDWRQDVGAVIRTEEQILKDKKKEDKKK